MLVNKNHRAVKPTKPSIVGTRCAGEQNRHAVKPTKPPHVGTRCAGEQNHHAVKPTKPSIVGTRCAGEQNRHAAKPTKPSIVGTRCAGEQNHHTVKPPSNRSHSKLLQKTALRVNKSRHVDEPPIARTASSYKIPSAGEQIDLNQMNCCSLLCLVKIFCKKLKIFSSTK